MRVVVLGAGIAGITTAWYLAAGGATVTVIDRGSEPASETSHANGGHISTQSGVPWTGPAGLFAFLTRHFDSGRTIRLLHRRDPGRLDWFLRSLSASRPSAYRLAAATLLRLARYNRDAFDALVAEHDLDLDLELRGVLALYRSERGFARARRDCAKGVQALSPREIVDREPAFADAVIRPAGALYYPDDATGDCRRFCIELAARAQAAGVAFRHGESAHKLVVGKGRCRGVITDAGTVEGDACVVALGAWSASFLRQHGLRLPILPLRGYTLTAPIAVDAPAPGGFIDIERHVACSRLGGYFRAAGMADFMGLGESDYVRRQAVLERVVREWYPALSRGESEYWSCLRPLTPDGPPILGASGVDGLWLNTGLGALGWTLGCGAGRILADLVLGKAAAIPLDGLVRDRFN